MTLTIGQTGTPASSGTSLGFTAVADRVIVAVCSVRDWNVTWTPGAGWSVLAKYDNNPSNRAPTFIFGKLAAGGETSIGGTISPNSSRFVAAFEVIGATLTGALGSGTGADTGNPVAPSQSPTAGQSGIAIYGAADWLTSGGNITVPSGFTSLGGSGYSTDWPNPIAGYKIIPSLSATETFSGTHSSNQPWSAASVILYDSVQAGSGARSGIVLIG